VALSDTQQVELRRILGYPAKGASASLALGYPAFASAFAMWQPYAVLERRMLELSQDEEVAIFGAEHSAFASYPVVNGVSQAPGLRWTSSTGVVTYGYVPTIRSLESDLAGKPGAFGSFSSLNRVAFRPDELRLRRALLNQYRADLADFLSVPLDPNLVGNRGRGRFRRV
jgi:hypothetical protein